MTGRTLCLLIASYAANSMKGITDKFMPITENSQ